MRLVLEQLANLPERHLFWTGGKKTTENTGQKV